MSERRTLPSKKVISTLLVILLISGIWVSKTYFQSDRDLVSPLDLVVTPEEITEEPVRIDSDGDGLLDWEEALWGTDPFLADTDGDGTSDTAEVEEEQQTLALSIDNAYQFILNKKLTTSEQFARDLYASVATAQNTDAPEDNTGLLEALTQEQILGLIPANSFEQSDFTSTVNTVQNISQYFKAMGNILDPHLITASDIAEINQILVDDVLDSSTSQQTLHMYQTHLEQTLYGLSAISVPNNILTVHTQLANLTEKFRFILAALEDREQEPLVAFAALSQYQDTVEELFITYAELGEYFQQYTFLY